MTIVSYKLYQKSEWKMRLFTIGLIATTFLFTLSSPTSADELTSERFKIKMGTINIGGGTKTGTTIKLIDSLGQTAPGQFDSSGYTLKSGFAYLPSKEPFSFLVSENQIDFGTLISNTFYKKQVILSVGGIGTQGYRVSLIEDHPLQLSGSENTFIPDTACDPNQKCTITTSAPWTASTAYGFGYNLSGADVDLGLFPDATYYRPLPNNASLQDPITIMSRTGRGKPATATVTFAINISPTQPNGTYQNSIQFIAIPSY